MRPGVGEVLHFSEDASIIRFVPHVARTASDATPFVWAVDAANAASYWFPRECPRAMAWVTPETTEDDRQRILGPTATRVHLVEYAWLRRIQAAHVYAYRFDAAEFEPYGDALHPPHLSLITRCVHWHRRSRSATCWRCTRPPGSRFDSPSHSGLGGMP